MIENTFENPFEIPVRNESGDMGPVSAHSPSEFSEAQGQTVIVKKPQAVLLSVLEAVVRVFLAMSGIAIAALGALMVILGGWLAFVANYGPGAPILGVGVAIGMVGLGIAHLAFSTK